MAFSFKQTEGKVIGPVDVTDQTPVAPRREGQLMLTFVMNIFSRGLKLNTDIFCLSELFYSESSRSLKRSHGSPVGGCSGSTWGGPRGSGPPEESVLRTLCSFSFNLDPSSLNTTLLSGWGF